MKLVKKPIVANYLPPIESLDETVIHFNYDGCDYQLYVCFDKDRILYPVLEKITGHEWVIEDDGNYN